MLQEVANLLRVFYRRKRFRRGATLTRFVARDIRRDVQIVDASEVDQGFVCARARTWNVLYASKGITAVPAYGEARLVNIERIWEWNGPSWGGPVADEETTSKA